MPVAKPKCRWLASLGVTKPGLAGTVPAGPRARSRWSVAAPRWWPAGSLVAATLAVTLSCGGDTTAPPPPPPPPPPTPQPTTVSVTPAQVRLTVGDSAQLAAEVRDQNGQVMTGATVRWASSDAAAATVTSAGLVRGVSAGSATIAATAGQASGNAAVTVSPAGPHPDRAALVALYNATGGPDWESNTKWLTDEPLDQWYGVVTNSGGSVRGLNLTRNGLAGTLPPELGDLANLRGLYLSDNNLSGTIPPELGNLANLEELWLYNNQLAGSIPSTLVRLEKLATLTLNDNAGICAPGTAAIAEWLAGIANAVVDFCNRQDRPLLEALHRSAGGPGWSASDGWLEGPALGEWHGIEADSLGRVVGIDLSGNGLAGRLPLELGRLTELRKLRVGDNSQLIGLLPSTFTSLKLTDLHYAGTGLCSADTPAFRDWLATITSHEGTGECVYTDRDVLAALYRTTGGTEWKNGANWLTDEPLGAWHGVTTDNSGSVTDLLLSDNDLSGTLPPELSYLSKLGVLSLDNNELSGPIPSELGNLANLTHMYMSRNQLSGTIPPEFGNLANVLYLYLDRNQLSGPIPSELGNLADVLYLSLVGNRLSGTIPPELGNLSDLERLYLHSNRLTGSIPPELGRLSELAELNLSHNSLDGPVPTEVGNLTNLEKFNVTNNAEMEGALPASLTGLGALSEFLTGGTALCAPAEPVFLMWLDGIRDRRVRLCEPSGGSGAYLTQAVQSIAYPVPLVADESALLRVFVWASGATGQPMPSARARFYLGGSEVHVANIAAPSAPIPTSLSEGDLEASANASIPASVVQPGLEMVIEIDPDGTLDTSLDIARRFPAEGRAAVPVQAVPDLDLTIVPFLWREDPDRGIVQFTTDLTGDHPAFGPTNVLLPVRDIDLKIHETVVTGSNDVFDLLDETAAIRALEGAAGSAYYMGMMSGEVAGGFAGVAYVPGRASFSIRDSLVIAHELGHNLNLNHAPCGGAAGPDPDFPTTDGTIGAWGYDMLGDSLVAPDIHDLMSYCYPQWISDYYFTKTLGYRVHEEATYEGAAGGAAAVAAGPERALLLWGGVGEGGDPFLEPAFIADARPSLPLSPGGEYTVAGRDAGGRELFSFSFDMPLAPDGDGRSGFAYALPARLEWAGALAAITLSGPGGSFALDKSSDRAAAILRDPLTGQVRGIFRDAPPGVMAAAAMAAPLDAEAAAALSLPAGLEVLASRGLPRPEDWRR